MLKKKGQRLKNYIKRKEKEVVKPMKDYAQGALNNFGLFRS